MKNDLVFFWSDVMKLEPPNNKANFLLISQPPAPKPSQYQKQSIAMEIARLFLHTRNGEIWESPQERSETSLRVTNTSRVLFPPQVFNLQTHNSISSGLRALCSGRFSPFPPLQHEIIKTTLKCLDQPQHCIVSIHPVMKMNHSYFHCTCKQYNSFCIFKNV